MFGKDLELKNPFYSEIMTFLSFGPYLTKLGIDNCMSVIQKITLNILHKIPQPGITDWNLCHSGCGWVDEHCFHSDA